MKKENEKLIETKNEIINEEINEEINDKHRGHSCCSGKDGQHNMKKHMLHMVLCCGLPMIILALLPFIARVNPWVAGVLGLIAPFICPLMMGGMLFVAFRNIK